MPVIDAHQHFWKYNAEEFDWINDDMKIIREDFLPADLKPLLTENNIDGCIAVQTKQTEEENNFLLQLVKENDFIKGIVGWIDLMSDDIEDRLNFWSYQKKIKGFRHILQDEENRSLMLEPAFKNGVSLLNKFQFAYDILIYPDQLQFAFELVKIFSEQKFVIDHIAKPYIKSGEIEQWKKDIEKFKPCENVYCKISGMVTEAEWNNHSLQTFKPYLDVVVETFGTKKIMYGSDWPVCLVAAASYNEVYKIAEQYFSAFSKDDQEDVFENNPMRFYNL
ncbi:MAG TPA: amidohydrolase family protein [Parafilimonas sp.]|nr:amidohydrolase family protein [Parafilimonas sp.]